MSRTLFFILALLAVLSLAKVAQSFTACTVGPHDAVISSLCTKQLNGQFFNESGIGFERKPCCTYTTDGSFAFNSKKNCSALPRQEVALFCQYTVGNATGTQGILTCNNYQTGGGSRRICGTTAQQSGFATPSVVSATRTRAASVSKTLTNLSISATPTTAPVSVSLTNLSISATPTTAPVSVSLTNLSISAPVSLSLTNLSISATPTTAPVSVSLTNLTATQTKTQTQSTVTQTKTQTQSTVTQTKTQTQSTVSPTQSQTFSTVTQTKTQTQSTVTQTKTQTQSTVSPTQSQTFSTVTQTKTQTLSTVTQTPTILPGAVTQSRV